MTLQEIKVNAVIPITGGLASLTTTDKSSLVNAVNEVNQKASASSFPTVTSGEKAITVTSAGPQKTYDLQDQVVSASSLSTADFSSGTATVTGLQGQISYDNNYKYECVGTNTWRRAALNGNLVDLYLADIDDSGGAKTSAQLNTAYSTAVVGQRVWGTLYLYEKKTSNGWKKIAIADA